MDFDANLKMKFEYFGGFEFKRKRVDRVVKPTQNQSVGGDKSTQCPLHILFSFLSNRIIMEKSSSSPQIHFSGHEVKKKEKIFVCKG